MQNSKTNPYLEQLRQLIIDYLDNRQVKVYLYGSRARGDARPTSDVDIALLPMEPVPDNFLTGLREYLEESKIPYTIDLVDLSQTDEIFRDKILREAVIWND